MCDVKAVGAVGLGLQGLGVISSFNAQNEQATAMANYQSKQTQAALTNFADQSNALNNRYSEEQEATALQEQQTTLKNLKAKAAAIASAAGSGVEGSTIDELFNGYDRDTAMSNYIAQRNLSLKGLQYQDDLNAYKAEALSTINLETPYVNTSSQTLLSGLSGIFSSYANYQTEMDRDKYFKNNGKVAAL